MPTKILAVGLSLPLRARLQGCLQDAEIDAVRSLDGMRKKLESSAYAALLLNEETVDEPLLPVLAELAGAFSGTLVLCTTQQHSEREMREMVHAHHVSVVLQHPIDALELTRALALQLGLQLRQSQRPASDSEAALLDRIWTDHQDLIESRLSLLEDVASGRYEGNPGFVWRAAHFLGATLGSFRLQRGTLLAREAEKMIGASLDGTELDRQRLSQLVLALRKLITESRANQLTTWVDSSMLILSDDDALVEQLEVEALLQHWSVIRCVDVDSVPAMVAEHSVRALVLDTECRAARGRPEQVATLLTDTLSCVVLSPEPAMQTSASVTWLQKPAWPADLMRAVLRTQLAPAPPKPPGVLVLDVDRVMLKLASACLEQAGFDVQTLASPFQFWDAMKENTPELVLMEVELPAVSGLELCRALRADPRFCAIPVMFLSGYTDAVMMNRGFEAGADDYLCKPLTPADLAMRVAHRLERQRQIAGRPAVTELRPVALASSPVRSDGGCGSLVRLRVTAEITEPSESTDRIFIHHLQRQLRASLRADDLVKYVSPRELLVGLVGAPRPVAEERVRSALGDYHVAVAVEPVDFSVHSG